MFVPVNDEDFVTAWQLFGHFLPPQQADSGVWNEQHIGYWAKFSSLKISSWQYGEFSTLIIRMAGFCRDFAEIDINITESHQTCGH